MAESIKSIYKPSYPEKYQGDANNIICRKIWKPLSRLKSTKIKEKFKNSDQIAKSVMWLPSGSNLSLQELKFICSKIKQFY